MQKVEEKKQLYDIVIIKHDNNHIIALSTDNYDKCFETWKSLVAKWEESITKKSPYSMVEPIVTAFDPGLIKEITLRPVMEVPESRYDNPYQKRMMKDGLSSMLKPGNAINPDMLDEGYR